MNMPYFLTAPADGHDMTSEIEACLAKHGACRLSPGDFLTHGIKMPEGTTIMGEGAATRLFLSPEVESGGAIRLSSFCTVKNLMLDGGLSECPEKIGERHGILFEGTAKDDSYDRPSQPHNSTITDCFIFGFSGGGITCRHTGYSPRSAIVASDCHVVNSGAGIHVERFSEFHKFTNILCYHNLYGCINNGGNNVFVNCGFTSNKTGFFIDNEHGQSPNCAHGSCVGCTFHHSDSNKGIGILIKNESPGFVFDGCQIGFSGIVLENADCVSFVGMNVLRKVPIRITGGTLTLFASSMFHEEPTVTIENNTAVRFDGCYLKDGTPFDPIKK